MRDVLDTFYFEPNDANDTQPQGWYLWDREMDEPHDSGPYQSEDDAVQAAKRIQGLTR